MKKKKANSLFIILISLFTLLGCVSVINKNNSNTSTSTSNDDLSEVADVDFSNLTYVAFGDSITYGADYSNNYSQMDDAYPELVSSKLGMKTYLNKGVSGATFTTNDLGRPVISNHVVAYTTSCDIISVMGGVNDWHVNMPLGIIDDTTNSTIYGALNVIANTLTDRFPNSYIFFMTPYKAVIGEKTSYTNNSEGYNLSDVANAVKEVAKKYDIDVLDLFNLGRYELEMYNADSDGIHPSQEFIKNYTAPQISKFIKENYKQNK